jgi:ATP-dependent Clp protease adaptor protein ClpS
VGTKTESDVAVKTRTKVKLSPPREHKVIYLNDEVTPMDFVIHSLMDIFEHDYSTAEILTYRVHEEGSAVVAVLPFEIAEHKGIEATLSARTNGYPLQVKIEPE